VPFGVLEANLLDGHAEEAVVNAGGLSQLGRHALLRVMIERPHPKGLRPTPSLARVLIAKGSRTVHTSGQVSIDEDGKLVGAGDLAAQTTQAMKNLGLASRRRVLPFADIVKTTTFVVNYKAEHGTVITDAKKLFWAGRPPTSA
jgi:enamine deaminase RidA (YjgF/YER057c/UK114 family)